MWLVAFGLWPLAVEYRGEGDIIEEFMDGHFVRHKPNGPAAPQLVSWMPKKITAIHPSCLAIFFCP